MATSSLYSVTGYVYVHKDARSRYLRPARYAKTETSKRPSQACVQAAEQV